MNSNLLKPGTESEILAYRNGRKFVRKCKFSSFTHLKSFPNRCLLAINLCFCVLTISRHERVNHQTKVGLKKTKSHVLNGKFKNS